MISTKNPFPGMNPFLELRWPDVHLALIGYIRDALGAELSQDAGCFYRLAVGESAIEH